MYSPKRLWTHHLESVCFVCPEFLSKADPVTTIDWERYKVTIKPSGVNDDITLKVFPLCDGKSRLIYAYDAAIIVNQCHVFFVKRSIVVIYKQNPFTPERVIWSQ